MINHVFTSFSAVQLYDHSFIQLTIYFTIYEYITNSQCDWFPVGLKAQLVEHCTGITKVKGLNLVQVLNFFQALISQLLKSCTTVLINHVFISFSAFQIYDLLYIQLNGLTLWGRIDVYHRLDVLKGLWSKLTLVWSYMQNHLIPQPPENYHNEMFS